MVCQFYQIKNTVKNARLYFIKTVLPFYTHIDKKVNKVGT